MENRSFEPPHAREGDLTARFHAAHHRARDPQTVVPGVSLEVLEAVAGSAPEPAREQLTRQAAELAEHLQGRQRELEGWEARLNARAAAHDAEVRAARLWLREQQEQLADRVAACHERGAALERRAAELAVAGATADRLEQRAAELDARQREIAQRERDLELRTRQWGEQVTVWERRRDGTEATLRAQAAALQQQQHDLQQAHAATATLQGQLRRELDAQQALSQTLTAERRRVAALQADLTRLRSGLHELAAQYEHQRRIWEQAHEDASERTRRQRARAAQYLKDLRAELQRQQTALQEQQLRLEERHQALEQRAAQLEEEQWAAVQQRLDQLPARHGGPPATREEDAEAVAQAAQDYVARQLQILDDARSRHRQELRHLARSLSQEHEVLVRRRDALIRWSESRQGELDAQAASLAARERELRAAHDRWQHDKQAWVDALDRQLEVAATHNVLPPGQDVVG